MKNVVQIVEDLNFGGIERVVENILTSLDSLHFKTYILCLSRGGAIAERLIENRHNVEILNIKNYHNPFALAKVVRWLKLKKIDIVHTHGYPAGVFGRMAAIIARINYRYYHIHSTYFNLNKRSYIVESVLSKFTRKVICCSEAVRRATLKKTGIAENKLIVIYNGIPEPRLINDSAVNNLKKDLSIPQDASVIGCVASLVRHKGHKYLLDAFKKIDKAYLLLIGAGPLRTKLVRRVSKLGITSRVIFAGSKIDITPYIQMMDIVVLPSIEKEGFGISLIEAMSFSKPVVATHIGGVPEVVDDGCTGILVKPRNSDTLADAINRLLRSPDLMHSMGLKGKDKYLRMFTLNRMIKRIEELYAECK